MAQISKFIIIAILAIGISGCTYKMSYNDSFLDNKITPLHKKNDKKYAILIDNNKAKILEFQPVKNPLATGFGSTVQFDIEETILNISKNFLQNYSNNIQTITTLDEIDNHTIVFKPYITDFNTRVQHGLLSGIVFVDYTFNIDVYINKNLITSKSSARTVKSPPVMAMEDGIYETNKALHKSIFDLWNKLAYTDFSIYFKNETVNIASNNVGNGEAITTGKQFNTYKKQEINDSIDDLEEKLGSIAQRKEDSTKWLFVVGIEQYQYTDDIVYAKHSAQMFTKTMQRVFGVPQKNTYLLIDSDATQAEIRTGLKKMLRRVKKDDTIYFYYNGHGVPVPSMNNEPFLMASNTEPDFIQDETFFSLQNIYTQLSNSNADKVIAIVDSCFSGVTDGKSILKGVAASRLVPKHSKINDDKMVVISAGNEYQYSNGYDDKGYRLFSYFVIKNILDGERDIKKLYSKTKKQTYETSIEKYGDLRVQEPIVQGNHRMSL